MAHEPSSASVLRWREEDVSVPGVRLHVRRVETPPAPPVSPVLLVHGLGVSGAVWQPFARRLLPAYAAVIPDLRGHGASGAPAAGYALGDYAADLGGLVQTLDLAPLPVVGHSLGALAVLTLAATEPDAVSAVVLLDPPIDADRRNPDVPEVARLRHAPPGELESYLRSIDPGAGDLLIAALAKQYRQAADAAYDTLLAMPRGYPSAWERARQVRAPCVLVQGDPARGGLIGDAAAAAFVEALPDGHLVKVLGASHAVHATQPLVLAQTILDFLGSVGAT